MSGSTTQRSIIGALQPSSCYSADIVHNVNPADPGSSRECPADPLVTETAIEEWGSMDGAVSAGLQVVHDVLA